MICQSKDVNQKWGITIALGKSHVMDKLRMNSSSVKEDLKKILKK